MTTETYEGREWHIDDFGGIGNSKTFHCDAWAYNEEGEKVYGTANYHSDVEGGGDGEWYFAGIEYDESEFEDEQNDWDDEYEPEEEEEDEDDEEM